MRLTKEQIDKIVFRVQYEAGEQASVYVYGSRLDEQARGGDLDLLVKTDYDLHPMQKAGIKIHLEAELGMPVDILTVKRQATLTPFQRIALSKAITLDKRA